LSATAAEDHLQQAVPSSWALVSPPHHWLIYIMFVINTYILTYLLHGAESSLRS